MESSWYCVALSLIVAVMLRSYLTQSFGCLGGNRRPIPPYKPLPPTLDSSFHREKEQDDKHLDKPHYDSTPESQETEELSSKKDGTDQNETTANNLENATKGNEESNDKKDNNSKTTERPPKKPESEDSKKENKQPPAKENKVNERMPGLEASKPNRTSDAKHEDPPKPVIPLEIKPTKSTKIGSPRNATSNAGNEKLGDKVTVPKSPTKSFTTSTLNIETSSSVHVIESTTTKTAVQSTAVFSSNDLNNSRNVSNTVALEPSKSPEFESSMNTSDVPTPTETLPATFTRTTSIAEKTIVHTPVSNTFTKNSGRQSAAKHAPRVFSFDKTTISDSVYNEVLPWPPRASMLN